MKKTLTACLMVLSLMLSLATQKADAQIDPMVDSFLAKIALNTHISASQNTVATLKVIEQVVQMIKDHVDISAIMKSKGQALANSLLLNNDLLTNTYVKDQSVDRAMREFIPTYKPNQDYLGYVNTLITNTYKSYAQALDVSNDAIKSSQDAHAALSGMPAAVNQLQALNEMIIIGNAQVSQLDKLIKIQSAMMKSMAYSWKANMESGNGGNGPGSLTTIKDISDVAAHDYCVKNVPSFYQLSSARQVTLMQQCKDALIQNANGTPQ